MEAIIAVLMSYVAEHFVPLLAGAGAIVVFVLGKRSASKTAENEKLKREQLAEKARADNLKARIDAEAHVNSQSDSEQRDELRAVIAEAARRK